MNGVFLYIRSVDNCNVDMKSLEEFYYSQEDEIKECLLALKSIILKYNDEFTYKWYYRLPCFMYKNQIFCYLWIDKKSKTTYIAIGKGIHINHPDLIKEKRTFTSKLMVEIHKDIPTTKIYTIFDEVMKLY
ncbi:DUF1801 domain-containing protein [uncultured Tenacibaculum sp.]|uniref:DUF1801 domain-containing protein n=1 Tax=uncultured Tenacibaculum sp. TaxID=174713 RepID=UPI002633DBAB|nr:DUF1801 domain-containing protein [uncultured Tenacibaculum sp.]